MYVLAGHASLILYFVLFFSILYLNSVLSLSHSLTCCNLTLPPSLAYLVRPADLKHLFCLCCISLFVLSICLAASLFSKIPFSTLHHCNGPFNPISTSIFDHFSYTTHPLWCDSASTLLLCTAFIYLHTCHLHVICIACSCIYGLTCTKYANSLHQPCTTSFV